MVMNIASSCIGNMTYLLEDSFKCGSSIFTEWFIKERFMNDNGFTMLARK